MFDRITITTPAGIADYAIILTDTFDELAQAIRETGLRPDRIGLVADTNTAPIYSAAVMEALFDVCDSVTLLTVRAGEAHKTTETINSLYERMAEAHFTRKSLLVSLGGGVVGDMTGFAAATYMRGIPFVQIPTTLLSQVDASIGGKTGVDFQGYKNMIGAFHMPSLVYINIRTLRTLPAREIRSGMAEIIKAALIKDRDFYDWQKKNQPAIRAAEPAVMAAMIGRACRIKQAVVENDPYEAGERKLLNYGHTIGHAIEKACHFRLTHGECVGLGMLLVNEITCRRGTLTRLEADDIQGVLKSFDLPVRPVDIDVASVIANTRSDKKREKNTIDFVVLNTIGQASISRDITEEDMRAVLESFC